MRIVFVSYNYSPDIHSPEEWIERMRFYIGWLECLAKQHTVIRVDQIDYVGQFKHNNIEYHCVDDGKRKNYFPANLNRFVIALEPDIVVVSSLQFPLQVIQLRNGLGKNVRIVLQHHAEKPFGGIKKWLQRWASAKVDAFLFTAAETGKDWVRRGNIHAKGKILELMEVSSRFYPMDKQLAKKKVPVSGNAVFLWVGRLNDNKDPLTAVKAFLRFTQFQPAAKLFMVYHTAELESAIKQLLPTNENNSPVVLVGKVEHHELLYWFNSADYFLSASHYEGSGTALAEAMSCACIPVCSDIPPFRKITGGCGVLFEPGNENAIYAALQQTEGLNREEMKYAARTHFEKALSFEAIAASFEEIINTL